jgi:glutaredoxin 3
VYTTSGCRYCKIAKAKLSELGIPFSEIDVSETPGDPKSGEMRKALAVRVGKTSVPQIFVAGEHVGGCDALLTAVEEGSFGRLLASAGIVAAPPSAVAPLDIEDAGPSIDLAPKDGTLNYHHHLAHLLNDGTDSPESCGEGADSGGGSGGGGGGGGGVDASAVALDLQARTLRLFDEFVSADGRSVDFKRMASSRAMRVYLASAARLSHPSLLLRCVFPPPLFPPPTCVICACAARLSHTLSHITLLLLHASLSHSLTYAYTYINTYVHTYTHTHTHSLQDMEEEAKTAVWINAYNTSLN